MFNKGDKVVKIIDVKGSRSATVQVVAKASKKEVSLVDSTLKYYADSGREIDSVFEGSGIASYIVAFDDGEVERLWPEGES